MTTTIDDAVKSTGDLRTNFTASYIKIPFAIWKWSLFTWIGLGLIGGGALFVMEFFMMPDWSASWNEWDVYYENYRTVTGISVFCFIFAYIGILLYAIFSFILLYRNWKVIQGAKGLAASSPGQAVGMLFVPF